jgi:hypothetical protein
MDQSLYILKPDLLDPRFSGLLFNRGQASLLGNSHISEDLEFIRNDLSIPYKVRLAEKWDNRIQVKGPVRKFNDYPCIELTIPAFSARAVAALKHLLEPNGELLPVSHKVGVFYVYNLLTVVDVLRKRTSKLDINVDGFVRKIDWYDCNKRKVKELGIFAMPEIPHLVHVTNDFKERVEECGLNGFYFIKVWPFEKGVDWEVLEQKRMRSRMGKVEDLAGESMIIRFRFSGKAPNKHEQALISRYEKELDDLLSEETSKESRYLGQIEVSETTGGEHRIFLSCLKASALEYDLRGWLENLDWPNELHYVKRNGHIFDTKANETRVVIR